jgi:hypothetical protein
MTWANFKKPKKWHRDAYNFWVRKGYCSFKEVAEQFKVGPPAVYAVANFYEWKRKRQEALEKLQKDNLDAAGVNVIVDERRLKNIETNIFLQEIRDQMARIYKTAIDEERDLTVKEKKKLSILRAALTDPAFDTKDLRDMTSDLRDNAVFYPQKPGGRVSIPLPDGEGQKKVEVIGGGGPMLVMIGPGGKDGKEKKEVAYLGTETRDNQEVGQNGNEQSLRDSTLLPVSEGNGSGGGGTPH